MVGLGSLLLRVVRWWFCYLLVGRLLLWFVVVFELLGFDCCLLRLYFIAVGFTAIWLCFRLLDICASGFSCDVVV